MSFPAALQYGQVGESLIARWLRARGWFVLPAYEVTPGRYKGPRLLTPTDELIVPDLLVFNDEMAAWAEAKRKNAFTYHHLTGDWTTGIDLPVYRDYLRVEAETGWPVWLFFLQEPGQAKDSPEGCPTGLYIGSLRWLSQEKNIHHTHPNGGNAGMIYWAPDKLKKLASLDELAAL